MTELPNDLLHLLARTPGEIFYFLLVLICAQASLFMALGQRLRTRDDMAAVRYTAATLGIVVAWAVVMVGLIVAVISNQPASAVLPPLERAAQLAAVLLLTWAFLLEDRPAGQRGPNLILLVALWAVIIGYVATGVEWAGPSVREGGFTISRYGALWSAAMLAVAVVGSVLTLFFIRRVVDAPLKVIFFALIGFGALHTLTESVAGVPVGDYPGALRLGFLGAMLIVPALLHRMIVSRLERPAPAPALPTTGPLVPPESLVEGEDTSSRASALAISERETAPVMKALGMMLERPDPDALPEQIVLAACSVLKADVGALLMVQDANYADVIYSYNKLLARSIETISVSLACQPTLVNAIERRTQRPLLVDRNPEELADLYTRFDIEQTGPTYFQPLLRTGEVLGVLMIGMPYTGRELTPSEQETLKGIGIIGANLVAVSQAAKDQRVKAEGRIIQAMVRGVSPDDIEEEGVVAAWEEVHKQLDAARDQIVQLSRQVTALKIELDDERSKVTSALSDTEEGLSVTGRILALTEEQQHLIEERERLQTRLRDAEAKLASATATGDISLFQAMLDVLNREKEDLQTQRDALQQQIGEMRAAGGGAAVPGAVREMLERMSDEKARLEVEREQLRERVGEIETQLQAFGVQDGASGLATLIGSLYDQQAQLQARYDALKRERDAAAAEATEVGRAEVERLRADLANLAADREALQKQLGGVRKEKEDLMARFEALKEQRARLMAEAAAYQQELTEAHVQQAQIRVQLQRGLDERAELVRVRDQWAAERTALTSERDQLLARIEGDRERLQQLGQNGVGSLTDMIEELGGQRAALERELNQAQSEIAGLRNELDVARIRAAAQPAPVDQTLAEQLVSLVQEFRTPMTAIVGYVDLILGESAGILGDMQRKFMQRVASNVKRLWSMTEDLHWVTVLDSDSYTPNCAPVDMVEVIEDAVTRAAPQLREKELALQLDLDDELPPINADREAMQEVIGQLLTNAYLASSAGGALGISARHQRLRLPRGDASAPVGDALVVAIRDSGGGIAPEDQPFVFTRRYKLENPLVPGLGDTGIGLAIAKALVQAHHGDIWFDTGEQGTTMFFAMPY